MVSTAQVNGAFLALDEHSDVAACVCAAVTADDGSCYGGP